MDPNPNSPEAERPVPRAHSPKFCASCSGPILWAAILDETGQRIRNENTGRFRSMPIDWEPTPAGNVVVYWREGEGFVCQVLRHGETPRAGQKVRTSHFATCPNAKQHRKPPAKPPRCGGVQVLDPTKTCESCGALGAFEATWMCERCTFGGSENG